MVVENSISKTEMVNQTMVLNDSRVLGFAEYGDLTGKPVMYFHGGNSSRLETAWFEDTAKQLGVRLIAPDRPGLGLSDFKPKRSLLEWSDDISQLADTLKIDTFALFGLSGGGPHVAAVAYKMPDRLSKVAIVSGAAPPNMPRRSKGMWFPIRLMYAFARVFPPVLKPFLPQMAKTYADPEKFINMVKKGMPEPDGDLAKKHPEVFHIFSQSTKEAHRNGIAGDYREWQLFAKEPWGFRLEDLSIPVHFWNGEVDGMVPLAMGRYMHDKIPHSQLTIVPDGGHFSTINNYINDILKDLIH